MQKEGIEVVVSWYITSCSIMKEGLIKQGSEWLKAMQKTWMIPLYFSQNDELFEWNNSWERMIYEGICGGR